MATGARLSRAIKKRIRPNYFLFPVLLQFNTANCNVTKGCYFLPRDCSNSNNCDYLITYQVTGGNLTIEMSAKGGWVSVGFNNRKLMVRSLFFILFINVTHEADVSRHATYNSKPCPLAD